MNRKPKPKVDFTDQAELDIERCRLFLERRGAGRAERRIREIYKAAWALRHAAKLYPVEEVHAVSGLEFRRKNVGQFAIIYAYLEPSPSEPNGVISIRRVRHAAEQDVLLRVEEHRASTALPSRALSTRQHSEFWWPFSSSG